MTWSLPSLARDLVVLVLAVVIGGLAGALAQAASYRWTSAETARDIALAVSMPVV
jgi:hypothetical protein